MGIVWRCAWRKAGVAGKAAGAHSTDGGAILRGWTDRTTGTAVVGVRSQIGAGAVAVDLAGRTDQDAHAG